MVSVSAEDGEIKVEPSSPQDGSEIGIAATQAK